MQLDVVAAAPREKRLLIGEAKWGRKPLSCSILTDLVQRSQRMPQVSEGWNLQYVLFALKGFAEAVAEHAKSIGAMLVSLEHIESTLLKAQDSILGQLH